ncbi:Bug family tripartite tricarboxylate transporter substrate binding protein [Rhodoplanes sp. Z2-YC6860]|uniref:Bug family tripartite tricarboxylate transporter substrate binding protein n=1 Tax=Rhodoplanes sp. Z2-YC6860 TaxID=674703 RepID=UPI00078D9537|nr:tripartite tricarboxylate transporter substrate binding protein [Rhodoplanes sp. Z2-YC6860]AMN41487.1 extra-cytoplasmic solute receptor protein [Rhodoplanes sp. Z2-YC6860]
MNGLILKALVLGLALISTAAAAQTFPDRVVRLVVPFAPGGVTDLAARVIGQQLSAKWGQQVLIENRPGAGGVIGVEAVIRSTPDGYTLLMATNGEITINAAVFSKPKYDAQKDLLPIAMATSTPFVWSANLSTGIASLAELVAAAKAKPGALSYSSAGLGSSSHMATEQFAAAAGIKLLHVPYRGGAPAATALMSGDVSVSAVSLSSLLPVIDSGKVKLLAITSDQRSSLASDVPTVSETGVLKDFRTAIWTGLFAPVGTPQSIVAKIETDMIEALKDPGLTERLEKAGAQVSSMPAAQLRSYIRQETDELKKIANESNIRVE